LPRSPRPSNGAPGRRLSAARETSQMVLAPSAATGRLDQTKLLALREEVEKLLRAFSLIP